MSILNKIRSSIGSKYIAAFLLCLVLPLLVLGILFTVHLRAILMEREKSVLSESLRAGGRALDTILREMNDISASLILNYNMAQILSSDKQAPTYEWFQESKSFESLLQSLVTKTDRTYHIAVLGRAGKLYRAGAQYDSLLTWESPIVKKVIEAEGGMVLLNRKLSGVDDNEVITLGRAVRKSNLLLGIILVDAPAATIASAFEPLEQGENRVCAFQRSSGKPLWIIGGEPFPALGQGAGEQLKISGTRYLYMASPSQRTDSTIAVLVPTEAVYGESLRLVYEFCAGLLVVTAGTILILTLISMRISRGLKRLNREVSRFGETGCAVALKSDSIDEVGQLSQGFSAMSRRIDDLLAQIRADERTRWSLEFKALQAQINPHMIYNTLNTITYLAQLQNVSNIVEVSSSFAHLLRMVSKRQEEWIAVRDELDCVRAYLSIKKYNLLWDIETKFEIDEAVLDCRILKLLLQPLIENAIVHGFSNENVEGCIFIRMALTRGGVCVEIADNGAGMDEETIRQVMNGLREASNSFANVGVYNTMERLRIQYGDRASFRIASRLGEGTRIRIEYPAEPALEEPLQGREDE